MAATFLPDEEGNPVKITSYTLWSFWKRYYLILPIWNDCAVEVALVFTSSASVERVFSLYDSFFDQRDQGCLEDHREASIKLRHNDKKRRNELEEAQADNIF